MQNLVILGHGNTKNDGRHILGKQIILKQYPKMAKGQKPQNSESTFSAPIVGHQRRTV
jgi:hypothetical protein